MQLRSLWQRTVQGSREIEASVPAAEKLWGLPGLLILFWLIFLLCMPFIERAWGERVFHRSVALSVLIQAGIVVFLLSRSVGILRTAIIAGEVVILTWAVEAIGASTSLPFGAYRYTDGLQPQLLGVPVLIPLAWLMMLPPSWAIAQRVTGPRRGLTFIALSALAFTAWDLFLDPQMVRWGLWIWGESPIPPEIGYFGIPWVNFAGWILTSGLITALVRPPELPERPLLVIYSLTWLTEAAGLRIFWDLSGPALSGFVGMGLFVLLAYYFGRRQAFWKKAL